MIYDLRIRNAEIFEKIVCDRRGRLLCVRFVVFERDGVLRGRIISVAPILSFSGVKDKGLRIKDFPRYLPLWWSHRKVRDTGLRIKDFFVSPYFRNFDFMTVIKIRAPSRSV
jgi:hypothetical protein